MTVALRCIACGRPAGALTTADVHDDREGAEPLCDDCAGITRMSRWRRWWYWLRVRIRW